MKSGMRCTGSERGRKAPPAAGCTLAARQVEERCAVCVPVASRSLPQCTRGSGRLRDAK